VNTGIAAGGGGIEPGGEELGGAKVVGVVDVVGLEVGGTFRGCVVVVTGAEVEGGATVVELLAGVTPYAAAGAESVATTIATRATPPRGDPNIGCPLGIRATHLQR
jgi:hypothetical protein